MKFKVIPSRRLRGYCPIICNDPQSALIEKAKIEAYTKIKWQIIIIQ